MLRRLKSPDTASETYWNFSTVLMADVAADLVGPNVVFHHSKLNFKWFDASDTVKWHQDIQFFPHTNYNVLTIGCYLADTTMDNGPLAALKGSHNMDLFNQYDADGNWTGMLSDKDAASINMDDVEYDGQGWFNYHPSCTHFALFAFVEKSCSAVASVELLHIGRCKTIYATPVAYRKHL